VDRLIKLNPICDRPIVTRFARIKSFHRQTVLLQLWHTVCTVVHLDMQQFSDKRLHRWPHHVQTLVYAVTNLPLFFAYCTRTIAES